MGAGFWCLVGRLGLEEGIAVSHEKLGFAFAVVWSLTVELLQL
jgi:hypothetical protein